jgi:DinB superfamily
MTTSKKAAQPETRSLGSELRQQLKALLDGGQAHATFDQAVKDLPAKLQGVVPEGLPYSAWQLLEHIRLAQRDILDFSRNDDGSYRELKWPDEYWPKNPAPPSAQAWQKSVERIREDRKAFEKLIDSADEPSLIKPFPWGKGQNLLREALLIADHEAYHVGELVLLRRLLGAWKS